MTFEEWFEENHGLLIVNGTTPPERISAYNTKKSNLKDAWNYQQKRIDELEKQLEKAENIISFYGFGCIIGANLEMSDPNDNEEQYIDEFGSNAREYFKNKESK